MKSRGLVESAGEPRVGVDVWHQQRLVVLRHPAGDPFARLEAQPQQPVRSLADRRVEVELSRRVILEQQRPVAGLEELADLGQDDVHDLADVQRRGQGFPDLVEDGELVDGALQLPEEILPPHFTECTPGCRNAPNPVERAR